MRSKSESAISVGGPPRTKNLSQRRKAAKAAKQTKKFFLAFLGALA